MKLRITTFGAAAAMLALTGHQAFAEPDTAPAATAQPAAPFIPDAFSAPIAVEAPGFKLVPLGPTLAQIDFAAYMSSIAHLQETFTRSASWPHEKISKADAMQDMQNEEERFKGRKSFAYAVLTPDGARERGCIYVYPSPAKGYDAVVRLWVTKAEYDAGFDAELYAWATGWIQAQWPFEKVAYPGRAIDWATWDALVPRN